MEEDPEYLKRVYAHADLAWKLKAYECGVWLSKEHEIWDADDFWDAMEKFYPDLHTHDPRALGPIVRRWKRDEVIHQKFEGQKLSRRKIRHSRPISIYRSLIARNATTVIE